MAPYQLQCLCILVKYGRKIIRTDQGSTDFPKIKEPPPNPRCQQDDMNQVPCWGTHNSGMTLVLSAWGMWNDTHFCMWRGKSAVITLKILVTTIPNLVAWATRHPGFVDSSYLVWKEVQWGSYRQLWGTVLALYCGCRDRLFWTASFIASYMSVTFFNQNL